MAAENFKILGLDLGTASIGWCLLNSTNIIGSGVRIFPEGMDRNRGEKSLNQDRRIARSIRRQGYRRARRKVKLKHLLIDFGLLPSDEPTLEKLSQSTNPYALRKAALEEKLEPYQLGRALYHLGQRRGYLSNRKTGDEKDGKVAQGITEISQAIENGKSRTLGEYLNSLNPHEQRIRGRYTAREMFEKEFELIWSAQYEYHPDILDAARKKAIYQSLFFQRPLKTQKHLVGYCDFEKDRKRAAKATLIAQEFRLWSDINNIKLLLADGKERFLSEKERRLVYEATKDKEKLSWEKFRELIGIYESDKINLEKVRKSGMLGNQTAALIKSALGARQWKALAEKDKEQLLNDLININEDRSLINRLRKKWQFDEEIIKKLLSKSSKLPKGYMHVSQKAMRKIVKYLAFGKTGLNDDRGYNYAEACQKAGYEHTKTQERRNLSQLPFPGIPNRKQGEHFHSLVDTSGLRNPMVERALFQVRKVVNAIIREYGKPDIIRVEMARDLKLNARQRDDYRKQQKKNEDANKDAEKFLKEELSFNNVTRMDKLKYRLWQECEHVCPYSGNTICVHELFTQPVYEIEHIIPYSRCLDDSFMNKTLCHRDWNEKKGSQTPWEAFHGDEFVYSEMLQRAKNLPYPKFKRFAADAIKELDEFVSQQLNETRYIARKTMDFLQQLGIRVEPVKGGTTALLRRAWGLNNILDDSGEKTRLDHRHHAIDALVVALTNRSAVQKINTHSSSIGGRIRIEDYPPPLPDMRQKVEKTINQIIVSHKSQRKIKGALHNEFLYSLTPDVDKKGIPIVAIRKSLVDMTASDLNKIRDAKVKDLALAHLKKSKNYSDAFKNPDNRFGIITKKGEFQKIHKVRLIDNRSVEPVGKPITPSNDKYRNVWTRNNNHVELIEYKDKKGNVKWRGRIVTVLDAANRKIKKLPIVKKDCIQGERFLAVLHKNDMVKLTHKGVEKVCHVQKMDRNQNIVFREHYNNNIDDKNPVKLTANSLSFAKPSLLEIDPIGKVVSERMIK